MLSTNGKLVTLAVSLELSAIALLFLSSNSTWLIYQYFFLHALASLAITPVAWTLMPANYKQPRLWVMFLLFSLSFFGSLSFLTSGDALPYTESPTRLCPM